jgi:hypothetical protein
MTAKAKTMAPGTSDATMTPVRKPSVSSITAVTIATACTRFVSKASILR